MDPAYRIPERADPVIRLKMDRPDVSCGIVSTA